MEDHDSFRAELQAHCCRIVGATHDADDVTQEG
jgi:DNA-directed RNA polymerase specialized sigma24 family protein